MEIIEQFGLNPLLLTAQIVNFLVIFYILKRFAYKPILQVLKNRQKAIEESLKQAEETKRLLEKTEEKEKNILREAQKESKRIIEDTKKQSEEMIRRAEETGRKQAEAILKDAREQIAFETRETEKKLTTHISRLAVEFLEKSVTDLFSGSEQEIIIKSAVKKIKKAD